MTHLNFHRATAVALALLCGVGSISIFGAGATTTRTRPFNRPPYYHGDLPSSAPTPAHLPTAVMTGRDFPDAWVPRTALERLALDLDRFLQTESLAGVALAPTEPGRDVLGATVSFGCASDTIGECDVELRQNVLTTTGGTRAWRERVVAAADAAGADHVLVLELRLAPQWIQQKGLSGKKEVRLGTDRVQSLAWLTSLDSPVWVLQLTGALVDREGKVARSGAEGLWAVRTPFRASMLRAERLISDAEVETVRTELVRDDLPGRPLVWQAAARQLVRGLLTGTED